MRNFFTSESVTEGHPDKICDQVSDAILDAVIAKDPEAHVAIETVVNTGLVLVTGELSTSKYVDIRAVVKDVVKEIGYTSPDIGFDYNSIAILQSIEEQSPDIARGVNSALETRFVDGEKDIGAGDQGLVFGYATNETPEFLPLPISLAHKLAKKLATVRKNGDIDYILPDGKSQVTVEYEDGKPKRVDTVVISTHHKASAKWEQIYKDVIEKVIKTTIPTELLDENTKYYINPTGLFLVGGPQGDSGLTGRKIIVDTYGGYSRHGGGAFSGKDPTKVDRSAAYAARWVAKNIVAAEIADRVEVQIAYAIGVARPVSVFVETFGTGKFDDEKIGEAIAKVFDLRPRTIISELDLRKPIYRQLAAYGHVGRTDLDVKWELTNRVNELKEALN